MPFLLVEAKKEYDAPGFRACQYQTAFPVRRLLKAQNDLHSHELSSEPCLVWFFAYQGEQWHLYAGTHENEKIVRLTSQGMSTLAMLIDEFREYMIYGKDRYNLKTAPCNFC